MAKSVCEQARGTRKWVILVDQALEVVAMGKSLRVVRAARPQEYLDYDPTGFADAGYGAIK